MRFALTGMGCFKQRSTITLFTLSTGVTVNKVMPTYCANNIGKIKLAKNLKDNYEKNIDRHRYRI